MKAAEQTKKDAATEREMYTLTTSLSFPHSPIPALLTVIPPFPHTNSSLSFPHSPYQHSSLSFPHSRAHLSSEVEFLQTKLEKASMDKSIAEAKVADFEREKKMIELDVQEILVRHKSEVTERMSKFARVCGLIVM